MPASTTRLLVVPHTHWDREWHQTFQQFRMRLVKCVNHLLHILDTDPNFTHFMLDGQTIVLDDYLEIHPEEAEHLLTYARSGRLLVGPWYIQPDEFLVSGESIVRNFQLGLRQATPYGGAMLVGYVPDCFGHIAQFPQILRGFGIENAVFWRGIDASIEQSEFWWDAPDGSRVLGVYLDGELGYSNARDLPLDPTLLLKRVEQMLAQQSARATTSTLLLMNGSDHLEPQEGLPAILQAANTSLEAQGQQLSIGTLPQYIQSVLDAAPDLQSYTGELRSSHVAHLLPGVLSTRMWIKQRNAACEELLTRWVEPLNTWAWALGGRYPSGLISTAWKMLLQNQPHDSICGTSIDQVHREMVARYDQCEQIATRLIQDALREVTRHVNTQASVPDASTLQPGDTCIPLVVMNSGGTQAAALAEVELQIYTPPDQLRVLDEQGEIVPHVTEVSNGAEVLNLVVDSLLLASFLPMLKEGGVSGYYVVNLVFDENVKDKDGNLKLWAAISPTQPTHVLYNPEVIDRVMAAMNAPEPPRWQINAVEPPNVKLSFIARDLPANGGRTYLLTTRYADQSAVPASEIIASETSIENAWLRVEVSPDDGSFTVTEKASGHVYAGLQRFEDGGDVGDLYNWTPPNTDTLITTDTPPKIELVRADALQATLRVTTQLMLPKSCTEDRQARAAELVACPVTSEITLIAGGRTVEVRASVSNHARDHRLRVLFSTPIVTESAEAEGTFMVNRRPVRRETANWQDWIEQPVDTHPQKRFVNVSDGVHGLALLNRGLPEYEVLPAEGEQGVTLALTLLRCVGWLSRSDLANRRGPAGPILPTPEAQMAGTWDFEYALYPYAGSWSTHAGEIQQQANGFNAGVWTMPASIQSGSLDSGWNFANLEPASLVLSAIKRAEDGSGVILRWYNPLDHEITADLTTALDFARADLVTLNEDVRANVPGSDDAPTRHWRITTPAGGIQSVRLSNG